MSKKYLGLLVAGALLLGACGSDEETAEPDTSEETNVDESISDDNNMSETNEDTESETTDADEDSVTSEEGDTADQSEDLDLVLDQDFEDIDWDGVNLSKKEFKSSLSELKQNFNADYEAEEDMDLRIDSVDFSGDTIEIIMTNFDDSEYADMTNGLLAAFLDSFYRQLYLHSDYSNGSDHPHIIIKTSDGEIITDQKDFIEFEEQP